MDASASLGRPRMHLAPLLALAIASFPAVAAAAPPAARARGQEPLPTESVSALAREASPETTWSYFRTGGTHVPLWAPETGPSASLDLDLRMDFNMSPSAQAASQRVGPASLARSTVGSRMIVHWAPPDAAWQPYVGYGFFSTEVLGGAADSSLRAVRGVEGGSTAHVLLGLVHDTRDDRTDPRRGGVEEVALRLASPFTGSRYSFGQLTMSARRFVPLSPRFVLAGRVAGDLVFGSAPFYELSSFGGLEPFDGPGGAHGVRGASADGHVGTAKAVANLELRALLAQPMVFGHRVRAEAVAFADAGYSGYPGTPGAGSSNFLASAGAGLRLVSGPLVVRVDAAGSTAGGGVHVGFGHTF